MKILSWMQSKLKVMKKPANTVTANYTTSNLDPSIAYRMGQATSKEEFSDWPQSLLAIGTFGIISNLRSDPEESHPQTPPTAEEEEEEVVELQEELISVFDTEEEEEESSSSAETHQLEPHESEPDDLVLNKDVRLQRSIMFSRGKKEDIFVDQKNNVIRKKSLTFLLRGIFTSSKNRLYPVRGSLPDPTVNKSRMEKKLRAILNKKIHPQTSTSKGLPNKYLMTRKDVSMGKSDDEISDHQAEDDNYEGSMWVKTDSEYIILEI